MQILHHTLEEVVAVLANLEHLEDLPPTEEKEEMASKFHLHSEIRQLHLVPELVLWLVAD
jgi:hypothetical protein